MSDLDAVVVGGGLAGLSCARELVAAGRSVVVLEARDRVGGRTLSRSFPELGGATFDLGGQWLGPGQRRALALAAELGLSLFPTHHAGKKVLLLGDRRSTYDGEIPSLPLLSLVELQRTLFSLDRLTKSIPVLDPTRAKDADALDAVSVEHFKRSRLRSPSVRSVFDAAVRVVFGAEPRDLSMLGFLAYLRAGGGLMKLVGIAGGAQEQRFVDGAQGLCLGLAQRLGARVHLSSPVRRIVTDKAGVTVQVDGGATHRARRAVIALPPPLIAGIDFEPLLPPRRAQVGERMAMGATVKCLAVYPRAFWREAGLSGEVVCDQGPVSVTFDNGSHDGRIAALLSFVVGDEARRWSDRPEGERKAAVLAVLARAFGGAALAPTHWVEQDWSTERWSGGCPVASMAAGAVTKAAPWLRTPVGPLHFAGTETAVEWTGYLEGALESGERAAREILAR